MSEPIDDVLASAVDLARDAAVEAAEGEVGDHLGAGADDAFMASHRFASLAPGYLGWYWSVSVSRAPDDDRVTVNDVVMLPGDAAVVAPAWTPYKERIRPGDLSPGDVLPPDEDDVRLVPAWSAGDGDEQVPDRHYAREVGLGREYVMSFEGREVAADRWHAGEHGPAAQIAQQASGRCVTCGFMISLSGDLSDRFGVCGNGQANADGRVVALAHGCGAHSGAKLKRSASPQKLPPHVFDTVATDVETWEPADEVAEVVAEEEAAAEQEAAADATTEQEAAVAEQQSDADETVAETATEPDDSTS